MPPIVAGGRGRDPRPTDTEGALSGERGFEWRPETPTLPPLVCFLFEKVYLRQKEVGVSRRLRGCRGRGSN